MPSWAVRRFEATSLWRRWRKSDFLGRVELAETGLQEDYIFSLCLFSIGLQPIWVGRVLRDIYLDINLWTTVTGAKTDDGQIVPCELPQ
jgi:hypothetical protein